MAAPIITILGGGDFGTAITLLLAKKHRGKTTTIRVWSRSRLARPLPAAITVTKKLSAALDGATLIINAIPSAATPAYLPAIRRARPRYFLNTAKGLVKGKTISQLARFDRRTSYAALGGPNIASQLVGNLDLPKNRAQRFTAALATRHVTDYRAIAALLSCPPYLTLHYTIDVYGVELCGALKQVYAMAFCYLLEQGALTEKVLLKKISGEVKRFLSALGADPQTFEATPAGLADLVVTCHWGRHGKAGAMLARGKTLSSITRQPRFAHLEAVGFLPDIQKLIKKHRLDVPVLETLLTTTN